MSFGVPSAARLCSLTVVCAFKFSADPEMVAKVTDVVGLYLNPPEEAIVLSIDENPRSKPWTDVIRAADATRAGRETHS
jgi:hypothetical protein